MTGSLFGDTFPVDGKTMARITDLKKPIRRLHLYDSTWYVVTIMPEGMSFKEYRKRAGRTVFRSWRELVAQGILPLFEGEQHVKGDKQPLAAPTPPPPHPED